MLCCQRNRLLGLAEALVIVLATVIAEKESCHLVVGQHLGVAQQLGVGQHLGVGLLAVHMHDVLGYREQVAE